MFTDYGSNTTKMLSGFHHVEVLLQMEDFHDACPSAISAPYHGGCDVDPHFAYRTSASLPDAAGAYHCGLRLGQRLRHSRASDRSMPVGSAWAAIHY